MTDNLFKVTSKCQVEGEISIRRVSKKEFIIRTDFYTNDRFKCNQPFKKN